MLEIPAEQILLTLLSEYFNFFIKTFDFIFNINMIFIDELIYFNSSPKYADLALESFIISFGL